MSPAHHPDPDELMSYATGTCPEWLALTIACHLTFCRACRDEVSLCNAIGGALLETAPADESARVHAIPAPPSHAPVTPRPPITMPDPCLPRPLATYFAEQRPRWRFLAPGVQHVPIDLEVNGNKVRVVRFKPGYVIPEHRHAGDELLLIFQGSIGDSLTGRRFGIGDVCRSPEGTVHSQDVGTDAPCISLTVNVGPPIPTTWVGRVLKRIARI